MKETVEEQSRRKNTSHQIIWSVLLAAIGAIIAFMVFTVIGQYYLVGEYLLWVLGTTIAMEILTLLWWGMVKSETGWRIWIVTHAASAPWVFIAIASVITAVSIAGCHMVYTLDRHNYLTLDAVSVFLPLFVLLMYWLPPVEIEDVILPFLDGGIAQKVVRGVIMTLMIGIIIWRFIYNF